VGFFCSCNISYGFGHLTSTNSDALEEPTPRGAFNVPHYPEFLLPRKNLVEKLKEMLLDCGNTGTLAITARRRTASVRGMGGIGKTVAASLLCNDSDVIKHFKDGK